MHDEHEQERRERLLVLANSLSLVARRIVLQLAAIAVLAAQRDLQDDRSEVGEQKGGNQ